MGRRPHRFRPAAVPVAPVGLYPVAGFGGGARPRERVGRDVISPREADVGVRREAAAHGDAHRGHGVRRVGGVDAHAVAQLRQVDSHLGDGGAKREVSRGGWGAATGTGADESSDRRVTETGV